MKEERNRMCMDGASSKELQSVAALSSFIGQNCMLHVSLAYPFVS